MLCEHPSVYTAGRRTERSDLPTNGAPVVDTDRGGRITWHGPGQLVAYPIVRLAEPLDVVAWVRDLEQVVIDAAAAVGVHAERVEGRSGAWVPGTNGSPAAKVGAIGLHVAEGVTSHGIAINCDNALDAYAAIVPCGIADAGVTTLSAAAARAGARSRDRRRPRTRGRARRPAGRRRHAQRPPDQHDGPQHQHEHQHRDRPTGDPRMTLAPEGRRMLRVEARNAETPIETKPAWIKTRATQGGVPRAVRTGA